MRELLNAWIPLADGCRLAARVWLPERAAEMPMPAILEYLPYRKDDATANQDSTRHPYFAQHGYAAVRVDLRGTGDSDGLIEGEYLRQEQDDALEVLEWLARQPWCNGSVGMIGYSWGGFNGLQIAARRPPQLKAVVSAYSTDDRYSDDCHYMGGCLLGSDMLKWATSMRAYNALPPDPRFRDDWREVWLDRLARTPAFIEDWLGHQTRDEFWRQGSVAQDYSAIRAATLIVGGWADAYTNAVPRLLERLTCERRGIVGPWAHFLPYLPGEPGPRIGFLQECLRWFDRWLKGIDTGVDADPLLRVWMQKSVAPSASYRERPGRWIAVDSWPPPGLSAMSWRLGKPGVLIPAEEPGDEPSSVEIASPQHLGRSAGAWCANGLGEELPLDQRPDDELSACFDSEPLVAAVEVLGDPVAHLTLSVDRPIALVAVRLCEVAPNASSTLVSWGLLNLTHRDGSEQPARLEPGRLYHVSVRLNTIGHGFSRGNRLRLAISPAYWPHAWPSPEPVTMSLQVGASSRLELPVVGGAALREATVLAEPEGSPAADPTAVHTRSHLLRDGPGVRHEILDSEYGHSTLPPAATVFTTRGSDEYSIEELDPLSAVTTSRRDWELQRDGWHARVVAVATMSCDAESFLVDDLLEAWEGAEKVFSAQRQFSIPRHGI